MYITFPEGSRDQQRAVKWVILAVAGGLEPATFKSKRHGLIRLRTAGQELVT